MMRARVLALGLAMVLCGIAAAVAAESSGQTVSLDISARPLGDALAEFGKQADISIVMMGADMKEGMTSRTLTGKFSPQAALAKLLEGTGLRYEYLDAKTIAIRERESVKKSSSANGLNPADQMRTAMMAESEDGKKVEKGEKGGDARTVVVEDSRIRPFSDRNVDLPRTIDDAQAYYIFDSETIERSGAVNVEDFLKQRLTMNTVAQTSTQQTGNANVIGGASTVNLRGLGADKTLILINGRRSSGARVIIYSGDDDEYQPDLNGIPLAAIDRIEVLPTSASGIYGGSALGGVVNVVLKQHYSGGEVRLNYDTPMDTDSPHRSVAVSYGASLENGKTHLMVSGQWSDQEALRYRDRSSLYERNLAVILQNRPSRIYSSSTPALGLTPNIRSSNGAPLVLKGDIPLGSAITYVPAGISASTPPAELASALLENAGQYNLGLPDTVQSPTGLARIMSLDPAIRSFQATLSRQWTPRLEAFLEFSQSINRAGIIYNPVDTVYSVPGSAPSNPFVNDVQITVPLSGHVPVDIRSVTRGATLGFKAQLPFAWTGQLDYNWSRNSHEIDKITGYNGAKVAEDLASGTLDPFVDTLLNSVSFAKYMERNHYQGSTQQHGLALRGAGPAFTLPSGVTRLAVGLEHRIAEILAQEYRSFVNPIGNMIQVYFPNKQVSDSAYMEWGVPLVQQDKWPLVNALEMQIAGRAERFTVSSGTRGHTSWPHNPAWGGYIGPTLDGRPYTAEASYTANNGTVGLKYQPVTGLIVRASLATAFLPPTPNELISSPGAVQNGAWIFSDPRDPSIQGYTELPGIFGGNPDLKPQHSRSRNLGLIWQPRWARLAGLRFNAEYYEIEQFDSIESLGAQEIVDNEDHFPGRVTRDADGHITLIDTTLFNLYRRETAGWDFSVDYSLQTAFGSFMLRAAQSNIRRLKNQFLADVPAYDAAGFHPSDSGGAAKVKRNISVQWERQRWNLGWSTYYVSSYKQYGAAGGPYSLQNYDGATYPTYVQSQGADSIDSQSYHDIFVGYSRGARSGAGGSATLIQSLLDGITVRAGVKNIFNDAPPFDAYYSLGMYLSPYGDSRLRSYWLSAVKSF